MPVIGNKRRSSSDATCDSSHCAFCYQRSHTGLPAIQHESCPEGTQDSSATRPHNEFENWLKAQTSSAAAHDHISLDKIGLPSSQLHSPPSKRNRASIDLGEASSSDSSDPYHTSFQAVQDAGLSLDMPGNVSGTSRSPWHWSHAWAERPLPVPAAFTEVGSFQELSGRAHAAQHTADIVCGVEFSPDGRFIASAGVAKQVFAILRLASMCQSKFVIHS